MGATVEMSGRAPARDSAQVAAAGIASEYGLTRKERKKNRNRVGCETGGTGGRQGVRYAGHIGTKALARLGGQPAT